MTVNDSIWGSCAACKDKGSVGDVRLCLMYKHTHAYTHRHTDTHRHTQTQTHRHTQTHTDTHTQTHTDTDTHTHLVLAAVCEMRTTSA